MNATPLVLHGYWRSSAAYRVRIALNLKGLPYRQVAHDLRAGGQGAPEYLDINPQGLVPALEAPGQVLVQSPAILEWLEDRYPRPALLPADPDARAIVRGMAALIGCDIHPLNNLRVIQTLRADLFADQSQIDHWARRWIMDGFVALESLINQHGKDFAYGEAPTLADCYLMPQVYSARRFGVDLGPYPGIRRASETAGQINAFIAAHPQSQPDADPA